jgi:hypothetical protein
MDFNRRLIFENTNLQQHLSLIESFVHHDNIFIIQFSGYTIKCVLDPIKKPNIYWIGPAPDHNFYRNDSNGELKLKKRTNLANTRLGIYGLWYTPDKTLVDIIERIKYSLTEKGEKELKDYMY